MALPSPVIWCVEAVTAIGGLVLYPFAVIIPPTIELVFRLILTTLACLTSSWGVIFVTVGPIILLLLPKLRERALTWFVARKDIVVSGFFQISR